MINILFWKQKSDYKAKLNILLSQLNSELFNPKPLENHNDIFVFVIFEIY